MKQLSHTDSIFVYNETPSTPLHISPILLYDSQTEDGSVVRFKDILNRFKERIHLSPVFRQKLIKVPFNLDSPYWIDDEDFDLEYHVRHLALPKPGDWRQFCILLARLHSRQLDLKRPPWEAYIIEGLDNINGLAPGSFAMYMKIHHSAIDGATGNQIIEALHDLVPSPQPINHVDNFRGEPRPSRGKLVRNAYFNALKSPGRAARMVKNLYKTVREERRGFEGRAYTTHDVKDHVRFNDPVTPHRVFGGLRMSLQDVKFIKNTVGDCTLNDVLLSIVGGGMREYLATKGELPENSLVAGVPISTRSAEDMHTQGGNQVAGMRLHLRTDVDNPIERLKLIHEDAVRSKAYANAVGVELMSTILDTIPSGLASLSMRVAASTHLAAKAPMLHTIITNVPGPQFPMYMAGARATHWLGAGCPLDGIGLFHTINSYAGNIFLTFICCRQMLPDPEFYHQCINNAFKALFDQANTLARAPAGNKVLAAAKPTVRKANEVS